MATNIHRKIVLSVSGKEAENSFNGLSQLVGKLGRELRKLTPGTKEFMDKAAELKEARAHFERVKNEIDLVNGSLKNTTGVFGGLKAGLANLGLGIKDMLIGFGAVKFNDIVTDILKISDAMADVQKTTGMALEEVKGLWDAFDEMDTRTSKLDRLKIAEVGGRLGVPKEQMASFVQEVDKAYVALGDSFQGGLENVVDSLGKIKGLFNETKGKTYAEAINEVGSALNELAASGTASEGNISDFALRVGALPDALKPSIDKVLGLGAAFEESGVDSQIAASGYSNFIKVAGENLRNFAYSMNMSYEEAQKLFNEKPEEFFLRFAQGMRDVPAEQTALIFDSLKIGTLEVQKAVGAAANRTDEFREAMGEMLSEHEPTCKYDTDLVKGVPLQFNLDFGGRINCGTISQFFVSINEIRFIKEFFVKNPKKLSDLVQLFIDYYEPHKASCNVVHLYHDRSGYKQEANSKTTLAEDVENMLRRAGWRVINKTPNTNNPSHIDKWRLINEILSEQNNQLPILRINENRCPNLIISMENAPLTDNDAFKKDKSSEKSYTIPQEHATHFSDTVDYCLFWQFSHLIDYQYTDSYFITNLM